MSNNQTSITDKSKVAQHPLSKINGLKQSVQSSNDLNQTLTNKLNTTLSKNNLELINDQLPLNHDISDILSNSLNSGLLNTKFEKSHSQKIPVEDNQYLQNVDNILKEFTNSQAYEDRKNSLYNENQSSKSLEREFKIERIKLKI